MRVIRDARYEAHFRSSATRKKMRWFWLAREQTAVARNRAARFVFGRRRDASPSGDVVGRLTD